MRPPFLLTLLLLGPPPPDGTLHPGVAYHDTKSNLDGSDAWRVTAGQR